MNKIFLKFLTPTALLIAVFMTGCGGQPTEDNSAKDEPTSTEALVTAYDYNIETADRDLDGDGTADTVYVLHTTNEEGYSAIQSITVNDSTFEISDLGYYVDTPVETAFYIADMDSSDNYVEIAIEENGSSNDPATSFYRYENNQLIFLGSITGHISEDTTIKGDGTIDGYFRLDVAQTWWAYCTYKLEGNKITMLGQDNYEAISETPCTVLKDITAYVEADKESDAVTLKKGDTLTLLGTDNASWLYASADDGKLWIYLENAFDIAAADGTVFPTWEILEGLSMAD